MVERLFEWALKGIAYAFNTIAQWVKVCGSAAWDCVNATITAAPVSSSGLIGCLRAEIVYSYRVDGELYTGIHEQPFLLADALAEYVERFGEGRSVVVRVKPGAPEVSIACEGDQTKLVPAKPSA